MTLINVTDYKLYGCLLLFMMSRKYVHYFKLIKSSLTMHKFKDILNLEHLIRKNTLTPSNYMRYNITSSKQQKCFFLSLKC